MISHDSDIMSQITGVCYGPRLTAKNKRTMGRNVSGLLSLSNQSQHDLFCDHTHSARELRAGGQELACRGVPWQNK